MIDTLFTLLAVALVAGLLWLAWFITWPIADNVGMRPRRREVRR